MDNLKYSNKYRPRVSSPSYKPYRDREEGGGEIELATYNASADDFTSPLTSDRTTVCDSREYSALEGPTSSTTTTKPIESLDFDQYESYVYLRDQRKRLCEERIINEEPRRKAILRWAMLLLIACSTALTAVLIDYCVRRFTHWKFHLVTKLIEDEKRTAGTLTGACGLYVAIALAYSAIAGTMAAYIEPTAAGSGISEIKTILNGVRLPRVVNVKTLFSKVIGITFAVSAGLPVGKEGPMIHSGAILGNGLTQGKGKMCGKNVPRARIRAFRSDEEKRDFVSCGASAGVAAAFGAPVGGVLFALEEGASYWSKSLTWRSFFTAIISTYVLQLFLSGMNKDSEWGELATPGAFSFGDFGEHDGSRWTILELPVFVLMGAFGGCAGALFVTVNRAYMATSHRRFVEVLGVGTFIAFLTFMLPVVFHECREEPPPAEKAFDDNLVKFFCSEGQYNPVATFLFAPSEDAIKQLFHVRTPHAWSIPHLLMFFCVYGTLTCLTYGIAVPSGLFIPSLLTGSAFGRLVGVIMIHIFGEHSGIDPGAYSLIGAAAFLGGVVRMTISLAVIILESTGNYQFGLPIMLVFFAARWSGNIFNDGIYDTHIFLRGWPLLEEKLPKHLGAQLKVRDVMSRPPVVFREIETVGRIVRILESTTHNGFPVIFNAAVLKGHSKLGTFSGIIQRYHMCILLSERTFSRRAPIIRLKRLKSEDHGEEGTENGESANGPSSQINVRLQAVDTEGYGRMDEDERVGIATTRSVRTTQRTERRGKFSLTNEEINEDINTLVPEYRDEYLKVEDTVEHTPAEPIRLSSSGRGRRPRRYTGTQAMPFTPLTDAESSRYIRYQEEESNQPVVSQETFDSYFPTFPSVSQMEFSDEEKKCFMDLRPYINPTPYTVHAQASVERAYSLFRGLGLRHLSVINDCHDCIGIITRHNLVEEYLEEVLEEKMRDRRDRRDS